MSLTDSQVNSWHTNSASDWLYTLVLSLNFCIPCTLYKHTDGRPSCQETNQISWFNQRYFIWIYLPTHEEWKNESWVISMLDHVSSCATRDTWGWEGDHFSKLTLIHVLLPVLVRTVLKIWIIESWNPVMRYQLYVLQCDKNGRVPQWELAVSHRVKMQSKIEHSRKSLTKKSIRFSNW